MTPYIIIERTYNNYCYSRDDVWYFVKEQIDVCNRPVLEPRWKNVIVWNLRGNVQFFIDESKRVICITDARAAYIIIYGICHQHSVNSGNTCGGTENRHSE